jgi:hypothetical protein
MVGSGKWKWEVGVMLYNTGSVEFVAFLHVAMFFLYREIQKKSSISNLKSEISPKRGKSEKIISYFNRF